MTTDMTIYEKPLTVKEEKRLAELEQIIRDNFMGFVMVGKALAEIRNSSLYRTTHNTFEDYCKDLWDMQRAHAYRLIDSSKVIENLSPIGDKTDIPAIDILPANEAQARELARLEPDEQRQVWHDLVQQSYLQREDDKLPKITALAVKKAVLKFKGKKLEVQINQSTREAHQNRTDFASEEFTATFMAFLEQIDIERQANWRNTSRKTVYKHLSTLLEAVADAGATKMDPGCAMQLSDREKLKKAGFRIFRMDPKSLLIEEWKKDDSWTVHSSHENPTEMSGAFKELLTNHNNLRA